MQAETIHIGWSRFHQIRLHSFSSFSSPSVFEQFFSVATTPDRVCKGNPQAWCKPPVLCEHARHVLRGLPCNRASCTCFMSHQGTMRVDWRGTMCIHSLCIEGARSSNTAPGAPICLGQLNTLLGFPAIQSPRPQLTGFVSNLLPLHLALCNSTVLASIPVTA